MGRPSRAQPLRLLIRQGQITDCQLPLFFGQKTVNIIGATRPGKVSGIAASRQENWHDRSVFRRTRARHGRLHLDSAYGGTEQSKRPANPNSTPRRRGFCDRSIEVPYRQKEHLNKERNRKIMESIFSSIVEYGITLPVIAVFLKIDVISLYYRI
jgi:hypothetical protein